MKKLVIAAVVVCVAAFAQASAIKWSATGMTAASQIKGPDGSTLIYTWAGQTGYSITDAVLINAADLSQADLVSGLRAGTYTWGTSTLDSTAVNTSSKITAKTTSELPSLAGHTALLQIVDAPFQASRRPGLIPRLRFGGARGRPGTPPRDSPRKATCASVLDGLLLAKVEDPQSEELVVVKSVGCLQEPSRLSVEPLGRRVAHSAS